MKKHIKQAIEGCGEALKALSDPTRDHTHCFHEKNPPCGQKIEHLVCCLCGIPHPSINASIESAREQERNRWLNGEACTSCGEDLNNNTGLSDTCVKCLEND